MEGERRVRLIGHVIEHTERDFTKALERIGRVGATGSVDDGVIDGLVFCICDIASGDRRSRLCRIALKSAHSVLVHIELGM